jgi:peptidoglycan/xylan/chitin deacetylase (PgdA/CDA1 family)
VSLACALVGFASTLSVVTPAQAATNTVVSLTFDDGNANQMTALPILNKYGMKGTFYIITGVIGTPNYLTRANLSTLAASGNEIGAHSVNHPDLTGVPIDEAKRQICNSRADLTDWGFRVTSFAYPYASASTAVENATRDCGFNSARGLGDIASAHGCSGCDRAETLPPADPYWLKAVDQIDTTWTLQQMKNVVTAAEGRGGGLVPFTFHNICDGCDSLAISPTVLDSFLSWLKARGALGTTVKTIDQAIGGTVKPVVRIPPPTNTGLTNTSLEQSTSGTGFPDCWMAGGWGSNNPVWSRTTDAHSGSFGQRLDISGYVNGDAKLMPQMDLGSCSPSVTPGRTYNLGTWYKATGITQYALYYRNATGAWAYWTSSPWFAAASTWTQATWTTPPVPAGASGMSFGLALITNGSLTTDDYTFAGSAGGSPAAMAPATRSRPSGTTPVRATVIARGAPTVPGAGAVRPGTLIAVPTPDDAH